MHFDDDDDDDVAVVVVVVSVLVCSQDQDAITILEKVKNQERQKETTTKLRILTRQSRQRLTADWSKLTLALNGAKKLSWYENGHGILTRCIVIVFPFGNNVMHPAKTRVGKVLTQCRTVMLLSWNAFGPRKGQVLLQSFCYRLQPNMHIPLAFFLRVDN